MECREALETDLPFLLEIDKRSCEREGREWIRSEREPIVRSFIGREDHFALIAWADGRRVGGILAYERKVSNSDVPSRERELLAPVIGIDTAYSVIFDIWVEEEFRRQKIATNLKRGLEHQCQLRDIGWIFTYQTYGNDTAIAMNERLGYQRLGEPVLWDGALRVAFVKSVA